MASAWISPPTRTELIENLVSGVGQTAACSTSARRTDFTLHRPLQSIQCRHSGRLLVSSDPQPRIRLSRQLGHSKAVRIFEPVLVISLSESRPQVTSLIQTCTTTTLSSTYSSKR